MTLQFRNVDASPDDDVATWPYEALVTAIDRGLVADWQPIWGAIKASPWGEVARSVEHYLTYREPDGVSTLFRLGIKHARRATEELEREEIAARIRAAVEQSGMSGGEFARLVGTSASRLSTYRNGRVTPSASMLARIERTAASVIAALEEEA